MKNIHKKIGMIACGLMMLGAQPVYALTCEQELANMDTACKATQAQLQAVVKEKMDLEALLRKKEVAQNNLTTAQNSLANLNSINPKSNMVKQQINLLTFTINNTLQPALTQATANFNAAGGLAQLLTVTNQQTALVPQFAQCQDHVRAKREQCQMQDMPGVTDMLVSCRMECVNIQAMMGTYIGQALPYVKKCRKSGTSCAPNTTIEDRLTLTQATSNLAGAAATTAIKDAMKLAATNEMVAKYPSYFGLGTVVCTYPIAGACH